MIVIIISFEKKNALVLTLMQCEEKTREINLSPVSHGRRRYFVVKYYYYITIIIIIIILCRRVLPCPSVLYVRSSDFIQYYYYYYFLPTHSSFGRCERYSSREVHACVCCIIIILFGSVARSFTTCALYLYTDV